MLSCVKFSISLMCVVLVCVCLCVRAHVCVCHVLCTINVFALSADNWNSYGVCINNHHFMFVSCDVYCTVLLLCTGIPVDE